MPVSSGNALRSAVNASSPPAEAPMPATGKALPIADSGARAGRSVTPLFGLAGALPPIDFRPGLDALSRMLMGKIVAIGKWSGSQSSWARHTNRLHLESAQLEHVAAYAT